MTNMPRHAGLVPASTVQQGKPSQLKEWTPEQVRVDGVCDPSGGQQLLGIILERGVG